MCDKAKKPTVAIVAALPPLTLLENPLTVCLRGTPAGTLLTGLQVGKLMRTNGHHYFQGRTLCELALTT